MLSRSQGVENVLLLSLKLCGDFGEFGGEVVVGFLMSVRSLLEGDELGCAVIAGLVMRALLLDGFGKLLGAGLKLCVKL